MNETQKLTENASCPDCGSTTSVKRDEVDSNVWNCWECGVWFDSKYEGEDDMRKRYPERAEFEDCSRLYFALTERQRRFIHAQVQGQDEREHAKE